MEEEREQMVGDFAQQEKIVQLLCAENDELKAKLCEATGTTATELVGPHPCADCPGLGLASPFWCMVCVWCV